MHKRKRKRKTWDLVKWDQTQLRVKGDFQHGNFQSHCCAASPENDQVRLEQDLGGRKVI